MAPDVRIHDKIFTPLIEAAEIKQRIAELGKQLNADYAGKDPFLIAILNGSFIFAADLYREMKIASEIVFVKLASYKGTASTGQVVTAIGLEQENLYRRHVLIIEDIIDTGKTLSAFLPEIYRRQPESVKIATFLAKPAALKHDVKADYTAFEIEDKFVVGYGLDYNVLGRNLPDLYVLKDE